MAQVNQGRKMRKCTPVDIMKSVGFRYGHFTVQHNLPFEEQDNFGYYRGRQFAILWKGNPYDKGEPTEAAVEAFTQLYQERAII